MFGRQILACSCGAFQLKELHSKISRFSNCMTAKPNSIERDARVMRLYEQVLEIEQRLIPTGLHVFGRASELQEKADLLRMVASFDRPEHGAGALPKLVADALGIDSYEELLQEHPQAKGVSWLMELSQQQ